MKVSINRSFFSKDIEINLIKAHTPYGLEGVFTHLEIPKLTDGKIELKEFYKFLMDLEEILNKSINEIEVANYEA